jgi:hypothetical protein
MRKLLNSSESKDPVINMRAARKVTSIFWYHMYLHTVLMCACCVIENLEIIDRDPMAVVHMHMFICRHIHT